MPIGHRFKTYARVSPTTGEMEVLPLPGDIAEALMRKCGPSLTGERLRVCEDCEHFNDGSDKSCDLLLRTHTRDGQLLPTPAQTPAPCRWTAAVKSGKCPLGKFEE